MPVCPTTRFTYSVAADGHSVFSATAAAFDSTLPTAAAPRATPIDAWFSDMDGTLYDGSAPAVFDALMASTELSDWRHTTTTDFRRTYRMPNRLMPDALRMIVANELRLHGLDTIKAVISGPDRHNELHIDFVPDNGSKVHAAHFIARELLGLSDLDSTLYTGDGGNDIDLLLASGAAALVRTSEAGLAEKLVALRPDIFLSPHRHIHGVRHALEYFGVIGSTL